MKSAATMGRPVRRQKPLALSMSKVATGPCQSRRESLLPFPMMSVRTTAQRTPAPKPRRISQPTAACHPNANQPCAFSSCNGASPSDAEQGRAHGHAPSPVSHANSAEAPRRSTEGTSPSATQTRRPRARGGRHREKTDARPQQRCPRQHGPPEQAQPTSRSAVGAANFINKTHALFVWDREREPLYTKVAGIPIL